MEQIVIVTNHIHESLSQANFQEQHEELNRWIQKAIDNGFEVKLIVGQDGAKWLEQCEHKDQVKVTYSPFRYFLSCAYDFIDENKTNFLITPLCKLDPNLNWSTLLNDPSESEIIGFNKKSFPICIGSKTKQKMKNLLEKRSDWRLSKFGFQEVKTY